MNPAFGLAQTLYMIGFANGIMKGAVGVYADCIWVYMLVPFAGAAVAAAMFGVHLKLQQKTE